MFLYLLLSSTSLSFILSASFFLLFFSLISFCMSVNHIYSAVYQRHLGSWTKTKLLYSYKAFIKYNKSLSSVLDFLGDWPLHSGDKLSWFFRQIKPWAYTFTIHHSFILSLKHNALVFHKSLWPYAYITGNGTQQTIFVYLGTFCILYLYFLYLLIAF